jgi:hypothetical protein
MGSPDPPGLAPREDSLVFEGTSVLACAAPFARTAYGEPPVDRQVDWVINSSGPRDEPVHDKEVFRRWTSWPLASQNAMLARRLRPVRQAPSRCQPGPPGVSRRAGVSVSYCSQPARLAP